MTTADLLEETRAALAAVPMQALGAYKRSRFRGERIVRVGEAWHLGVLLIGADAVHATGEVLRAADAGRRGYTAESARERAMRRDQALRGGFAPGEIVQLGWETLDPDAVDAGGSSGPLALIDGVPQVRWSPAAGFMPLEAYLRERRELLGL